MQLSSMPEAGMQLAQADMVLLNKADLADEAMLVASERAVQELNPTAEVRRVVRGELPLSQLLDRGAFDNARLRLPNLGLGKPASGPSPHGYQSVGAGRHSVGVGSVSLSFNRRFDRTRFLPWLQRMVVEHGADLLRAKGIVAFSRESRRFVFQAVHMTVDSGLGRAWAAGEAAESKLVFIGRELDESTLREELAHCLEDVCEV
jgi:G3E family GTPase